MWKTKEFKTLKAYNAWIDKNQHRVQWEQIFVNNAYAVTYKPLRVIY